jgi:hypothetical protein
VCPGIKQTCHVTATVAALAIKMSKNPRDHQLRARFIRDVISLSFRINSGFAVARSVV